MLKHTLCPLVLLCLQKSWRHSCAGGLVHKPRKKLPCFIFSCLRDNDIHISSCKTMTPIALCVRRKLRGRIASRSLWRAVCSGMQSPQHYLLYYLALGLYQMLCKSGSPSPCYDERSAFSYEPLRRHQIRVQRLFLALAANAGILKQSDILSVSFCISLCYFAP